MFDEDDLLPLSALQHLLFCERRAALVHIEGVWAENVATIEGAHLHEKTHTTQSTEVRGDLRIASALCLRSLRLGLSGKADVVEFHRVKEFSLPSQGLLAEGVSLPGVSGLWRPFPVEYKRGRLRHEKGYEVQLCAQALCLEEMLNVEVPAGAIFYGKTRRRYEVDFDHKLREETVAAAARLHKLARERKTPPARYEKKCEKCSLLNLCMPKAVTPRRNVRRYLSQAFSENHENIERG